MKLKCLLIKQTIKNQKKFTPPFIYSLETKRMQPLFFVMILTSLGAQFIWTRALQKFVKGTIWIISLWGPSWDVTEYE